MKAALKKHSEDDDDSMSQNNEDHEFTGVNIHLLTDDKRLEVKMPNYDTHYRLYFENPQAFENQQKVGKGGNMKSYKTSTANRGGVYHRKVIEERNQETEKIIEAYFEKLTDSQQIDLIGKYVPHFSTSLHDLQQVRLKYLVLLDRVKKHASLQFKNNILGQDKMVEMLGIHRDLRQRTGVSQGDSPLV